MSEPINKWQSISSEKEVLIYMLRGLHSFAAAMCTDISSYIIVVTVLGYVSDVATYVLSVVLLPRNPL